MEEMKQTRQTGLSREKLFNYEVMVLCNGEFVGSSVIMAHDSVEAECIMRNRLDDVFSPLSTFNVDAKAKIIE